MCECERRNRCAADASDRYAPIPKPKTRSDIDLAFLPLFEVISILLEDDGLCGKRVESKVCFGSVTVRRSDAEDTPCVLLLTTAHSYMTKIRSQGFGRETK